MIYARPTDSGNRRWYGTVEAVETAHVVLHGSGSNPCNAGRSTSGERPVTGEVAWAEHASREAFIRRPASRGEAITGRRSRFGRRLYREGPRSARRQVPARRRPPSFRVRQPARNHTILCVSSTSSRLAPLRPVEGTNHTGLRSQVRKGARRPRRGHFCPPPTRRLPHQECRRVGGRGFLRG